MEPGLVFRVRVGGQSRVFLIPVGCHSVPSQMGASSPTRMLADALAPECYCLRSGQKSKQGGIQPDRGSEY